MVHTILIVDNEPVQRDLLTYSLQNRLGYRTVAANTASDAGAYFCVDPALRPDLILYDCPDSEEEASAGLRALGLQAPVVVLVKYGDYDAAASALGMGAQDFLTKPVAMERMSTTFRNILLLRDARREVERLRRERPSTDGSASYPAPSGMATPPLKLTREDGNIRSMEEIEAEAIRFAMQYYHGRMTEVARRLGIGRSTLYRKLSSFGSKQDEAA